MLRRKMNNQANLGNWKIFIALAMLMAMFIGIAGAVNLVIPSQDTSQFKTEDPIMFKYKTTDAINITSCLLYRNGTLEQNSTEITFNKTLNFSAAGIPLGIHFMSVNCTDNESNIYDSTKYNILVPVRVNSLGSVNNSVQTTSINFTFNASSDNAVAATLYGNFSGTWKENQTSTFISNKINGFNLTNLEGGIYIWNIKANESAFTTFFRENYTMIVDTIPPTLNTSINNTSPKRDDIINISANLSDNFGLSSCQFITNGTADGSLSILNKSISGTSDKCSQNFTIGLSNENVINFTIIVNDSVNNKNQSSHVIEVANTPPDQVILVSPAAHNFTINRTPTFVWNNITEIDNESVLFNLKIICVGCSDDSRDLNLTTLNYTPSELLYLGDDNFYYNWSITAIDNSSSGITSHGPESEIRNITIESYVSLSLLTDTVDFGALSLGQNDNTTDNVPAPLILDNDGNVFTNISLYADGNLWESASTPTDKFQFKIANVTTKLNSFNWSESIIDFTNLSITSTLAIIDLDYHDTQDSAEVDLHLDVPLDESAGEKRINITFEAKRSK